MHEYNEHHFLQYWSVGATNCSPKVLTYLSYALWEKPRLKVCYLRNDDLFITWGVTFHVLMTLDFVTFSDLWTSTTFDVPNDFWNYIWLLVLHVLWTFVTLEFTYDSWTSTHLSYVVIYNDNLCFPHHHMMKLDMSLLWMIGAWQWLMIRICFNGDITAIVFFYHHLLMVHPPSQGSSRFVVFMVLWSSIFRCVVGSSCTSFVHPLPGIPCVFLPFLEYLFLQSLMIKNYQSENILLYHVSLIFSCSCHFDALKIVNRASRRESTPWNVEGWRRRSLDVSKCTHVP